MNGISALSIAETLGSGDFPQPSKIIKITFLFMEVVFCTKLENTDVLQLNYCEKDGVNYENGIAGFS